MYFNGIYDLANNKSDDLPIFLNVRSPEYVHRIHINNNENKNR